MNDLEMLLGNRDNCLRSAIRDWELNFKCRRDVSL